MTGAVNVGIMPLVGLVFDVRCGDGDTTLPLLGSLVNGVIFEVAGIALFGLTLGNGSS